ncbi:hypothetical protein KRP22_011267 [Phytophthora ramorum]|nr:RxLR effector protein [Phytophthora ramorum]
MTVDELVKRLSVDNVAEVTVNASLEKAADAVVIMLSSLGGGYMVYPQSESDESFYRETGFHQELDCPRGEDPTAKNLLTKPEDERECDSK